MPAKLKEKEASSVEGRLQGLEQAGGQAADLY
jgi:hypothetical protein